MTESDDFSAYIPDCRRTTFDLVSSELFQKISVLNINIRSIANKFSEFSAHLSLMKNKFSFIIVTETWLQDSIDFTFELDGYTSVSLNRVGRRGGGIKVFHQNSISSSIINDLTTQSDTCERIFLRANIPSLGTFVLGAIYRPPSVPILPFVEETAGILESLANSRCVIVGDININTLNYETDRNVRTYVDTFSEHNFFNEINLPTYHSPITQSDLSCLDHMWHNLLIPRASFVLEPNLSDHYGTCLVFDKKIITIEHTIKFRDYSIRNLQNFKENIDMEFRSYNSTSTDPNDNFTHLFNFLIKLHNKFFPVRIKKVSSKRFDAPWISKSVLRCIKKKHRWYNMMKQRLITVECYKKLAADIKKLLRSVEDEYYVKKLQSLSGDSKKNWRLLNKLMQKHKNDLPKNFTVGGVETTNETVISNNFSQYFRDHPKFIHDSIPASVSDFSHLIPIMNNSFNFEPCTAEEILFFISQMKKEGSIKDISRQFLQLAAPHVSSIMAASYNLCLGRGLFPDLLKISKITPVHKKGSKSLIENYRPISILSNLSKIFESIICSRLQNYFSTENLLSERQYGFRAGKNTELAVFNLLFKVLPAIESKKFALCLFLDYSACFDTIDRNLLIQKLQRYGLSDRSISLIKSYFDDRHQYVKYRETNSIMTQQTVGVIQGSRLGPLYSLIFIQMISTDYAPKMKIFYMLMTLVLFILMII